MNGMMQPLSTHIVFPGFYCPYSSRCHWTNKISVVWTSAHAHQFFHARISLKSCLTKNDGIGTGSLSVLKRPKFLFLASAGSHNETRVTFLAPSRACWHTDHSSVRCRRYAIRTITYVDLSRFNNASTLADRQTAVPHGRREFTEHREYIHQWYAPQMHDWGWRRMRSFW